MTTVNLDVNTSTIRLRITVSHHKSVSILTSSYFTNFFAYSKFAVTMCFLLYTFSRGENYVLLKNRNPSENVLHKHFPDIRISYSPANNLFCTKKRNAAMVDSVSRQLFAFQLCTCFSMCQL